MKSRPKFYSALFFLAVFIFLAVFFTSIHPLMIYDSDDWTYIAASREPFPSLDEYNPGKIFPETFQGLMSFAAVFCIYPFTGDYVGSISWVYGIVFCLFVLLYIYEFYRFIRWLNPKMPQAHAFAASALFLLFHFSIFKISTSGNMYLFQSADLNCYYNYTVPDLMNASLVMYLVRHKFKIPFEGIKTAAVIAFGYLSIYSNLFMTGILMAAVGVDVIVRLVQMFRYKSGILCFLKERWYSLLVLVFWLRDLYFEANGSRAQAIGQTFNLHGSLKVYYDWRHSLNALTMCIACTSIGIAVILLIIHRKDVQEKKMFKIVLFFFGALILNSMFLIALCAKTGASYLGRPDTIFGVAFYGFMTSFICMSYVIARYPKAVTVAVLCGMLLFLQTADGAYGQRIFQESTICHVKPSQAKLVDDDLVNQVVTAFRNGETDLVLHVPKGNDIDNWPHANYMGGRIDNTLFKHGLIGWHMNITVEPDSSMNAKYNLGY